MMLSRMFHNVSNLPYYGTQDIYQLVLNVLLNLRKFSNHNHHHHHRNHSRRAHSHRLPTDDEREEDYINSENLHNIFYEYDTFFH